MTPYNCVCTGRISCLASCQAVAQVKSVELTRPCPYSDQDSLLAYQTMPKTRQLILEQGGQW